MRRLVVGALGVAFLVGVPPAGATRSVDVSVSDLVDAGSQWSGATVTVEGELIGDYGYRDDGWVWTQLNGDEYTEAPIGDGGRPVGGNTGIGIRMPYALAEGLDPPGRYGVSGPIVKVTGIWRWHDVERQGESFLEVDSLEVVQRGHAFANERGWAPAGVVGLVLMLMVPFLWPWRSRRGTEV